MFYRSSHPAQNGSYGGALRQVVSKKIEESKKALVVGI
jgi:hypothetical protein